MLSSSASSAIPVQLLSGRRLLTKTAVALFCVGLALLVVGVHPYGGWTKAGAAHKVSPCAGNSNKLLSILNILCNNTQNTTLVSRDACYGCFFRAGGLPAGGAQLLALSQCATIYLNNTVYNFCAQQLQAVVNGYRPTPSPAALAATGTHCYQGYCEFVRCVRRTNANTLIDNCFLANLLNRNLVLAADRITLFTNITSCVLSRARCSAYNPITGELQTVVPQRPVVSAHGVRAASAAFNALQITPAGDIRIVRFPGSVGVADYFCSPRATLQQDSFDNADC